VKVETLEIPPEEVKKELETLQKGIKEGYISKSSRLVRDLLAIYKHLEHKGKIIDVYSAFKKAGLTKHGHPKLAIVRADAPFCHLYKKRTGGAIFSRERKSDWGVHARFTDGDVELPAGTFKWPSLEERFWKTVTPMIPPRISVAISAKIVPYHYHILFETEYWTSDPMPPRPPKDPILGRMLTPNMFAVYATWHLTDLERRVLLGKLR